VNAKDNSGASSIHIAASVGNVPAIAQLLAHGATLDAVNDNGRSALHFAAGPSTASALLDAGADPTILDMFKDTAETFSSCNGCLDVYLFLKSRREQTELDRSVVSKAAASPRRRV
jgi:ankyrin repeat protein